MNPPTANPARLSRRALLSNAARLAALGGVCGFAGSPSAAEAAAATPARSLKIGVSTLGFADRTNAALARELAAAGIRHIQLFLNQTDSRFWKYNGRSDVSSLTAARCREIAATYHEAGLTIHSLGVYTNLIHPDAAERRANLAYFEAMMEIGAHMGVRTFVTEPGHHSDATQPAPRIPLEFQDQTWPQMIGTVRQLEGLAAKHDAIVLFEPFYRSFLASAKRARIFLEEINSPRIRLLLDPANLIELNDLEEMFGQLAPWIDCIHAKDRKLHTDNGVPAGQGDLDYGKLVTLAATHAPSAPLVLEYVGAADFPAALAHLRAAMRRAGITPA